MKSMPTINLFFFPVEIETTKQKKLRAQSVLFEFASKKVENLLKVMKLVRFFAFLCGFGVAIVSAFPQSGKCLLRKSNNNLFAKC